MARAGDRSTVGTMSTAAAPTAPASRIGLGLLALAAGLSLAAFGIIGEVRLHVRRGGEESAVRRDRERLRDAWVASSERAVDAAMEGQSNELPARLDSANAAWKAGVEAAAERESREFEAYAAERRWTLLALFTGAVTSVVGAVLLAQAWLRRRPTAPAA
jgi:hypothetical protein